MTIDHSENPSVSAVIHPLVPPRRPNNQNTTVFCQIVIKPQEQGLGVSIDHHGGYILIPKVLLSPLSLSSQLLRRISWQTKLYEPLSFSEWEGLVDTWKSRNARANGRVNPRKTKQESRQPDTLFKKTRGGERARRGRKERGQELEGEKYKTNKLWTKPI